MLKWIFTLLMIIISLSIELSYGSPRINSKIAGERADNLSYQLTENVFPEHYTLKITPLFNNKTFIGYAKILIHLKKPTDNITLHQKNLNITKEKIYLTTMDNLVINIKDARNSGTEEQEFYTIIFPNLLTEDKYYLNIPEFRGADGEDKGFYFAEYTDKNGKLCSFAITKFESTTARYAFPCFDEPSFRAKFKLIIVRPSNYHSRSNSKLMKSTKLNTSLYEDEFEDTPSMSTYLVEYIVSELKLSIKQDTDFYNILARPEVIDKSYEKYALSATVQVKKTLETYLNVNYSMNKMDEAAIPNNMFPVGGSESWGFIIYQESIFLLTPQTSSKAQVKIYAIISHEFTHQWFGNLVAIKWWRYVWMKEGFAKFLEYKITDQINPEWRKMELFVVKLKHDTLKIDSTKLTRDMNQNAGSPNEIRDLYDKIAYEKAACVIHMLEAILTPDVFQRGLTNYLQDRAFQSSIPIDLYRNLQTSLGTSTVQLPRNLNIENIMTTWDSQKGYPLVYVERNYDKTPKLVKLTQSRYIFHEVVRSPPRTWYIPINYASKSDPNFSDTRFGSWLLKPNEKITISNLKRDDWLILNKQQAYYYRINYDVKNWKLIAKELKENFRNIHILNRAQLIDDSFDFAKMDQIDYSIPLEISSYLDQEDDYITDLVLSRNLDYIAKIIRGANVERYFRNYVIRSFESSYKRLGINPMVKDTVVDKLHRVHVVSWMCKYNYSECRANTWKSFDHWRKTNKSLVVDLKEEILCNAIRHGNVNDWDYLYLKWETTSDVFSFKALGCTENATLLQRFLDISLMSEELTLAVQLISEKGLVGTEVAMLYVAEHFNFLRSKYSDAYILVILGSITRYFTSEVQLENCIKLLSENRTLEPIYLSFFENKRPAISQVQKRVQQIGKFYYQHKITGQRSGGNIFRTIPNTFDFIFYTIAGISFFI